MLANAIANYSAACRRAQLVAPCGLVMLVWSGAPSYEELAAENAELPELMRERARPSRPTRNLLAWGAPIEADQRGAPP